MYDGFYSLNKKPFQLNPDSDFFFNSEIHRRALTYMNYGLTQGEGFIVITGKPGTGKTMLVKQLVNSLDKNKITLGIMVSSQVGADELLKVIAATFRLPYEGEDKAVLLTRIERFFIDQSMIGKRVLMIVDEAQNLPKESLEELRMLSNFEMSGKPLFQTFLIGQKQLGETLFLPEMEQLRQRIVATCQLKPLDEGETKSYILFRLQKAGWQHMPQFEEDVFAVICGYTEGIPRKINALCNRVLLFGYLEELQLINLDVIHQVIADIEDDSSDDFHDNSETSSGPLEQRVAALEQIVATLRQALARH